MTSNAEAALSAALHNAEAEWVAARFAVLLAECAPLWQLPDGDREHCVAMRVFIAEQEARHALPYWDRESVAALGSIWCRRLEAMRCQHPTLH